MANIEIRFPSKPVEKRTLSKSQPVSIGRSLTSDVHIDDESVSAMHCRISWNRDAFEVSAGSEDGVDLNGTLVRRSLLRSGDLIRIGPVDIQFDPPSASAPSSTSWQDNISREIELKPVSQDQLESTMRRAKSSPFGVDVAPRQSDAPRKATSESGNSKDRSSQKESKSSQRERSSQSDSGKPSAVARTSSSTAGAEADEEHSGIILSRSRSDEEDAPPPVKSEKGPGLLKIPASKPVRPGQEDTLRSPFVLGLGATALVLLLTGAIFYFVIGRESAQRAYDAAYNEFSQGKFTQAIELFDKFVATFPRHPLAEDAIDYLWQSRIEKEITGASPNWKIGLSRLLDAIAASRDRTASSTRTETFRHLAERITLGAADTAATRTAAASKPRELLAVAEDARKLVGRYSPEGKVPEETVAAMSAALEKAEASIFKQETFDSHVAEIEQALKDKKPMAALDARLKLLALYPDFETNRKVASLLAETLVTERDLVAREELEKEAVVEDRPAIAPEPLTLSPHTRSRTDEPSAGRTVCALAADCCYGIDSVTGEPVWRRVIGLDTPFFPIPVTTPVPGLLMFDTHHAELLMVDQRTGKLAWRQLLEEGISGAPLVHEGQIYAPSLGNHLYKIDLETGRITTKLTFSQRTLSPPALVTNGERLVVPGDRALFYTLTTRPLACMRVDYTAHRSGLITAPLITMGSLLLASQGSGEGNSKLRVLDVRTDDNWLKEVAQVDIPGQLRDAPTIRGKELFVPSSGERITAFTVSDDPGQRLLTQVATMDVQTPHPGPMFLVPGPDGQLWFSGSAIRKLQVKTESIKLDPAEIAAGTSTQPLQNIGQYLYVGRRLPYSSAVLFTQADRESMSGLWRIVLGSRILAATAIRDGGIVCVTEVGDVYVVPNGEIEKGGFKRTSNSQLKIPPDLSEPLRATPLPDGRIVVDCGGTQPQLWIIAQSGQVERQAPLEHPLEAAPVLLSEGIVLPLPGRLRMLRSNSGGKVEDYLMKVDKEKTSRWKFAARVDDSELIAVDDQGRLVRVQFRGAPVAHLAEVAARALAAPVDVPFSVRENQVMLATADGLLQILDSATLETASEVKLEQPASSGPTTIGKRLFVETAGNRLLCFDIENELKQVWAVELEGGGISGPPARFQNQLIVSQRDGTVQSIDPNSGESRTKIDIGQPIVLGPNTVEDSLLITTIDGSLRRIDSALQKQP